MEKKALPLQAPKTAPAKNFCPVFYNDFRQIEQVGKATAKQKKTKAAKSVQRKKSNKWDNMARSTQGKRKQSARRKGTLFYRYAQAMHRQISREPAERKRAKAAQSTHRKTKDCKGSAKASGQRVRSEETAKDGRQSADIQRRGTPQNLPQKFYFSPKKFLFYSVRKIIVQFMGQPIGDNKIPRSKTSRQRRGAIQTFSQKSNGEYTPE